MKRAPRVMVNLYLAPEQKAALDKLAKAAHESAQVYLREGLNYVLKKYAPLIEGEKDESRDIRP